MKVSYNSELEVESYKQTRRTTYKEEENKNELRIYFL